MTTASGTRAATGPAQDTKRRDAEQAPSVEPSPATSTFGALNAWPALRRLAVDVADPLGGSAIPQDVLGALRRNRGSGQPLPSDLSAGASQALGRDLSPVRVHTDPEAAALARSVQSVAFTHGNDIYFSAGSYRPAEPAGQQLIAHELGHIGQPDSGGQGGVIGRADDPAEAEADRAATGVLAALRRQAVRTAATPGHGNQDHGNQDHGNHDHAEHGHNDSDHAGGLRRQVAGCHGIRRMKLSRDGSYAMFSGYRDTADRAAFAEWVQQLQNAKDTATLQNLRVALHRTVLDPSDHETIAMSLVQRALDKLAAPAVAPGEDEQPKLQNLPQDQWWKLFIEGDKHDGAKSDDQNAMRFDSEQSPGYYAAMSRAFQTFVAKSDRHELSFADYDAMHLAVTQDTLSKSGGSAFSPVPHKLSAKNISFPMTKGEFPNPEALEELRAQGMLGLDAKGMEVIGGIDDDPELLAEGKKFDEKLIEDHEEGDFQSTAGKDGSMLLLTLKQIYQGQGPIADFSSTLQVVKVKATQTMQLLVNTNRVASSAEAEVSGLFKTYYAELKKVASSEGTERQKRRNKLIQVARLVRALHVGHYFHDANGRLNTMVLLNRLLIDCGFSPVLMDRTDIFGGAFSEIELVRALELGFKKFAREVNLAHLNLEAPVDAPIVNDAPEPPPVVDAPRDNQLVGASSSSKGSV